MTTLGGIFALRTPLDLLGKLEADFRRMQSSDPNSLAAHYAAFDFFVTAEHLPDWLKHASGGSLTSHRRYEDGALVSHVASGAKHFHVEDRRHKMASDTAIAGSFHSGSFSPSSFSTSSFDLSRLVILLGNGESVDVLDVAKRVIGHWRYVLTGFGRDLGNISA